MRGRSPPPPPRGVWIDLGGGAQEPPPPKIEILFPAFCTVFAFLASLQSGTFGRLWDGANFFCLALGTGDRALLIRDPLPSPISNPRGCAASTFFPAGRPDPRVLQKSLVHAPTLLVGLPPEMQRPIIASCLNSPAHLKKWKLAKGHACIPGVSLRGCDASSFPEQYPLSPPTAAYTPEIVREISLCSLCSLNCSH